MGKIEQTIINRFNGGIATDLRAGNSSQFAMTEHFDTHSYPGRLKPYRSHKADESQSGAKAGLIRKLVPGSRTSSDTAVLWALGQSVSSPAIFYHDSDPSTSGWTTPANNVAAGTVLFNWFFFYNRGVYGLQTSGDIFKYNTSAGTMDSAFGNFGTTLSFAQPVHHPADDNAYFFEGNAVHRLNNNTWFYDVLILPANLSIVSACAYGNYLAIACKPIGAGHYMTGNTVFLWDRDSSLATLSHKIDFGTGHLQHIASLDNKLIAVVDRWINAPEDADVAELVILGATEGTSSAVVLNRVPSVGTTNTISNLYPNKIVQDNILYFPYRLTNGVVSAGSSNIRDGIWSVDSQGRITLEVVEEDLASASAAIDSIARVAGFWFIVHSGDGSIQRTDENANYTYTSIGESLIFDSGDPSVTKKLIGVSVTNVPNPTAGQVVLKFRKDAETAWTTIFTNTTDDSISESAVNYSSGTNLPEYKEIQFRIESTGGAEITSLKFKSEIIDKDLY